MPAGYVSAIATSMKRNLFYKTIYFWLCFIRQIDMV